MITNYIIYMKVLLIEKRLRVQRGACIPFFSFCVQGFPFAAIIFHLTLDIRQWNFKIVPNTICNSNHYDDRIWKLFDPTHPPTHPHTTHMHKTNDPIVNLEFLVFTGASTPLHGSTLLSEANANRSLWQLGLGLFAYICGCVMFVCMRPPALRNYPNSCALTCCQ